MSKENIVEKLRGLGTPVPQNNAPKPKGIPEAEKAPKKGSGDEISSTAGNQVQSILQNNIWNHAAIMDILWVDSGKSNATNRSKFLKKFKGEESNFTKDEAASIMGILSTAAASVNKKGDERTEIN